MRTRPLKRYVSFFTSQVAHIGEVVLFQEVVSLGLWVLGGGMRANALGFFFFLVHVMLCVYVSPDAILSTREVYARYPVPFHS